MAEKAERTAAILPSPEDREDVVAAAYLHDVGHAPELVRTGFHAIDGAEYVRREGFERVAALVAHHSEADVQAGLMGLLNELASFPREVSATSDALTFCDVTTAADGSTVSLDDRVADVVARYGPEHMVTRAVIDALPELRAAVERTRARLRAAGILTDARR